jgi:hypothetical protein
LDPLIKSSVVQLCSCFISFSIVSWHCQKSSTKSVVCPRNGRLFPPILPSPGRRVDFEVPLSGAALRILHEARRIKLGTAGHVFTTNGDTPISGFSKWKAHFDALMLAERCKIAAAYGDDVDKITVPGCRTGA